MELREESTKDDAEEVILMISKMVIIMKIGDFWYYQVGERMRSSMIDTFSDNIGQLDFSRSMMG